MFVYTVNIICIQHISRHNISIKGLVYCSSHDCYFDIDREVSTAACRSSSGDSVDLLSQTICTSLVVSDWCITNLAHGWWVSIQSTGTLVEFKVLVRYFQRRKLISQRSVVVAIGCYVV